MYDVVAENIDVVRLCNYGYPLDKHCFYRQGIFSTWRNVS